MRSRLDSLFAVIKLRTRKKKKRTGRKTLFLVDGGEGNVELFLTFDAYGLLADTAADQREADNRHERARIHPQRAIIQQR